ncbi:multidrug transporter subunit MdtD [Piscinibacter koreensis]|uniref:Multidrug transporter subunit MdtD n=1 Tax=Piscinibacter koreensis TaxID=2742824 RepID=A0A7Y6TVT3_9BURK|nr:multidrug transporter subunit MdtD [Schlegelella koreensis]NUZ05434.1 multidrug transporter subunit MdtD [Schlegelella koreensis]
MLDPATRRLLPWLVAIAFFMQTLDSTILNTTLPRMAESLGESPLRMQSVVIAYMLTVALFIPASGWLADRFGTRRVFLSAIGLFSFGSLLCALSPSLPWLVAARVVQGIGGALLLPVGRLAVLRAFPRDELLKVLSFVSIPGLVGPLVGPPLGGWLVEVASWHWVFLINLPVGALGVLAAMRYMPDLRGAAGQRFDVAGFVLFSLGLVLVSLGLQGLGERALSVALSLLMLAAGLAAMSAYWFHAARHERPLFSLALFKIPTFSIGIVGNLFSRLGSGAMPFMTPLFLQLGLGYSPSRAGLTMVPTVIGAMLMKTVTERVIRGFGYRRVLVVNTLLLGLLMASFGLVGPATPHAAVLVLLGVFGLVNSMQFTAMNTLTLGDLDDARASSGNSLLSVVMQLAMSLGVACAGALLAAFGGHAGRGEPIELRTFHLTYVCLGVLSGLAAGIFAQLRRTEGPAGRAAVVDEG